MPHFIFKAKCIINNSQMRMTRLRSDQLIIQGGCLLNIFNLRLLFAVV